MADEDQASKTEKPTGKRVSEAEGKGQFARSQEIASWGMLFGCIFGIIYMAPWMMRSITSLSFGFIANPDQYPTDLEHLRLMILQLSLQVGLILAPLTAMVV